MFQMGWVFVEATAGFQTAKNYPTWKKENPDLKSIYFFQCYMLFEKSVQGALTQTPGFPQTDEEETGL